MAKIFLFDDRVNEKKILTLRKYRVNEKNGNTDLNFYYIIARTHIKQKILCFDLKCLAFLSS